MREVWESPRAKQERARREQRMAFEVLADLVDTGDLDRDGAFAIARAFNPTLIAVQPAHVYQAAEIGRLERSIDSAAAEGGDA